MVPQDIVLLSKRFRHKQANLRMTKTCLQSSDGGDMFLLNVVENQRTTQRHIPEDDATLHNHCCEKLKSCCL
jgi:hypothetical protein